MPKYAARKQTGDAIENMRQKLAQVQADKVAKSTSGRKQMPQPQQRYTNLISFITGWYPDELLLQQKAAVAVAYGLGDLGSSVCVVNPPADRIAPHSEPVPSGHPMVSYMFNPSKREVIEACSRFDYVLTIEADNYHRNVTHPEYEHLAERFIAMCGTTKIKKTNPLKDRIFFLATTPSFSALYLDNKGYPSLLAKPEEYPLESNVRLPEDLTVPVIGCYYPYVDSKELAKAVLGIGDPRYFYTSESQSRVTTFLAFAPKSLFLGAQSICAMFTFIGFSNSAVLGSLMLAVTLGVAATNGVKEFAPRKLVYPSDHAEKPVDNLYPLASGAHVKYALTAPPLGLLNDEPGVQPVRQLATAMYAGDLVWTKACERYEETVQRFNAYELDITKMLDAPLMVDYACATTAAFVQAMHKARDLRLAVEDGHANNSGQGVAVSRGLFAEAVSVMEIAFEVAEKAAIKEGIRGFAEADRKKIARSKQLFKVAQDSGSSDHERMEALKQARKQLEGVLVVSDSAIALIESAGARATLTQAPADQD